MNDEKKKALNLLKTSRGQIDGIIKMIEDERYCVDISKQILSSIGLLRKANNNILEQHIRHCVKDALNKSEAESEKKLDEIIDILNVYLNK